MFSSFKSWLTGSSRRRDAQGVYISLVQQSRNPFLYTDCAVADTLDGRFDLILLHLFLFLRLPHASQDKGMRRLLLESLFDDMDRSLREMGVGDMGVGKRIQKMSKAAFGRLTAYKDAGDDEAFRAALVRNIYRGEEPPAGALDKLSDYVKQWRQPAAEPEGELAKSS